MSSVSELYQSVILDHNRTPRNYGRLEGDARRARGYNPLCGDECTVWLKVEGDTLADVRFEGQGCAISKASASMMTEAVKGKSPDDAEALFRIFHALVTGEEVAGVPEVADDDARLGKLVVFAGVRDYPVRVKCATLAWHTLRAALENRGAASTE